MNRHRSTPATRRRSGLGLGGRAVRWTRLLLAVALLVLSGVLVFLAPAAAGTGWGEVGHTLDSVGPAWMLGLSVVWIAGLWSYGVVMTASMPGLSTRQALSLNLAGSAVANSLPLGGAVSLALVTAMSRSWGFSRSAVTTFLMLTNLWNVLIRLLFGALAVAWFLTAGPHLVTGPAALVVAALAVGLVVAVGTILISEAALAGIGRISAVAVSAVRARFRPAGSPARGADYATALLDLRAQMITLLRASWIRLTLGMLGYIVLLALLLGLGLRALGDPQPVALMLAVVGIERLVTALPITPGGAGAAEISLVACLTAAGVSGTNALTAALLYRFFTFIAEFPAGAAVAFGWHLSRSRLRARSGAGGIPRIEQIA
jgi:uncharacterized membrane protein YbhN (UPF0104 family)